MANASAKKRLAANSVYVRNLQRLVIGANALYVLGRVFFDGTDALLSFGFIFTLLLTSLFYYGAYWWIERTARPTYDANGELTDGGGDLSVGGQTELAFDVVYLTAASQFAALYSQSAFWLLAVVPVFAGYKGFQLAKPFIDQARQQAAAFQQQQQQQQQRQQQQPHGKRRK
jgi:hypothetical protein